MQPILITDQYTDSKVKSDFYTWLTEQISGVIFTQTCLEYSTFDELRKNLSSLPRELLIFKSPYMRIPFLREKLQVILGNNFKEVRADKTVFYFLNDGNTEITQDSIHNKETDVFTSFKFLDAPEYIKPKLEELPRIILYTHNRDNYLKLTLDSLLNSLYYCPEIPVTVVLNDPTEKVLHVALEKQSEYPQIEVLRVNKNCAFAGMNIAIQWYNPTTVVLAEDDFILPDSSKHLFPVWPYEFMDKLEHGFDMVGWKPSFENIPYDGLVTWKQVQHQSYVGWQYSNICGSYPLMAQLLMVKKDFWISCADINAKATFDTGLKNKARKYASPLLPGYHIGFNQNMNGFGFNKGGAFNLNFDEVDVTSLKTYEKRKLKISDVFK